MWPVSGSLFLLNFRTECCKVNYCVDFELKLIIDKFCNAKSVLVSVGNTENDT